MVALAADRDTTERASEFGQRHAEVAASSTQFYRGGIIVLETATGLFKKGVTGTGLIAVGRSERNVLTGAANTRKLEARSGIFKYGNSTAGDLIAAGNVGADCYIVDDQTVALTNGGSTRSKAGEINGVDTDGGVYVSFYFPLR